LQDDRQRCSFGDPQENGGCETSDGISLIQLVLHPQCVVPRGSTLQPHHAV
jgi:hypothetical protein